MENLDLTALIGEKNAVLRRECERRWNQDGPVNISNSEWYVLSRINIGKMSIPEIARAVDISRQATHKCLRSLKEKQVIDIVAEPQSKRERFVVITEFGYTCIESHQAMKRNLEAEIEDTLGTDSVRLLKELLMRPWLS